jgi:hypothetical protein
MRWFSLLLAASLSAQRPAVVEIPSSPPKTAFEPPKAAAAASLAESTAASPKDLLTLAEKTNYAETARFGESRALADRMAERSPWLRVVTFGKTPQGRDLFAVIASKDRAFTPEAARATGKPVILLQSCIHPGEVDGKEASEMLLRDVAVTKRYAAWLDKAILVNIPIFNVDGHERFSAFNRINQDGPNETGFRVTAQRLNLNRDFMKADAPEMKAWLKFFNAWLPDFFLDNHVTDGMDFQYDVTIDIAQNQEVWATVAQWTRERYLPYLNDAMATDGHIMGPYGSFIEGDPAKGFATGAYSPRYSTGYAAIQNRPGLLVETHSLKSFKTRTWAHYDIMKRSIEAIVRDPAALRAAVAAADRAVEKLAGSPTPVHLDGKRSDESEPFTFKALRVTRRPSDLAGAPVAVYEKEPLDIATKLFAKSTTTVSATVPEGYFVPAEWTEIIERLSLHGIRMERLDRAVEGEFDTFHLSNPRFASQPFEGRISVSFQSAPVKKRLRVPAGTAYVPLNQRTARVAINLLEPDAPDALVRWGFLHAIFEQKEYFSDYIMEPIAQEMTKSYPELRKEFDKRVASDAAFAKSPRQRLQWWFERSPYYEPDKDVYPILRVAKKTW